MTTMQSLHPFEQAGLGKAPFSFIGMTEERGPIRSTCQKTGVEIQIGAPGQPMGTCDYCGQGIAIVCHVQGADGKRFKVGSDCVEKVYKNYGQESADPVKRQIDRARKDHARKVRHERKTRQLAAYHAWAEAHETALRAAPNPCRQGETRWDQYLWFTRCAGTAGNLKLYRELRKALDA